MILIGNLSKLIVFFRLERQIDHHLIQTFALSTLIVMSWFSFWLGLDAIPGQVALLVTSMLKLVTMSWWRWPILRVIFHQWRTSDYADTLLSFMYLLLNSLHNVEISSRYLSYRYLLFLIQKFAHWMAGYLHSQLWVIVIKVLDLRYELNDSRTFIESRSFSACI